MKTIISLTVFSFILSTCFTFAQADKKNTTVNKKNRAIILTDIGADPDDSESMVRLLLYSNEIDIEGIIATTSCWQKNIIHPDYIKSIVNAYGKVQPNLIKHEPGFPGVESLLKKIKNGIAKYGMQDVVAIIPSI